MFAKLHDGTPLTPEWLSSNVLKDQVQSIEPVEETWISGVHSSTVKLKITYASNTSHSPSTLYWKRVVLRDLPTKASYKLYRDVYSYKTETSFYKHLTKKLNSVGVHVPECYYAYEEFVENDLNQSRFLLALEDMSNIGYQKHVHLSHEEVYACLSTLARLHATFWDKTDDLTHLVWPEGSYWTLDKRPQNELDTLGESWRSLCDRFVNESPIFSTTAIHDLGERIVKCSAQMNEKLRSIQPKTFIHGDFKSANMFMKSNQNIDVAIIDWQWSGVGAGITDVMYLITSTYSLNLGRNDFALEKDFIIEYCNQLQALGIYYDKNLALEHFKIAFLDMARIILAYFFANATPQSIEKAASDPGEVGYCCSIPHSETKN
jgi:aminoglycoside/choline kinase family phosphotransferase